MRKAHILAKLRIVLGWCSLVMVYTVQSNPKNIHDSGCWRCQMLIVMFLEQYEVIIKGFEDLRLPDVATCFP